MDIFIKNWFKMKMKITIIEVAFSGLKDYIYAKTNMELKIELFTSTRENWSFSFSRQCF